MNTAPLMFCTDWGNFPVPEGAALRPFSLLVRRRKDGKPDRRFAVSRAFVREEKFLIALSNRLCGNPFQLEQDMGAL